LRAAVRALLSLDLDRRLDAADDQCQHLARERAVEGSGRGCEDSWGIFDEPDGGVAGAVGAEGRDHACEMGAQSPPSRGLVRKGAVEPERAGFELDPYASVLLGA